MLLIYGIPNSQPVRAVLWLCLQKGIPFELRLTSQNRDAKEPAFLEQVNPRGTVPAIDDDGVVLWESHAILVYLCEKHGITDLWPEDLEHRARVNQYLHFHHRNTRELVVQWSRALWPTVFGVETPDEDWYLRNTFPGARDNETLVAQALDVIETLLGATGYLAGGPHPTLADIAAYEELGQNQPRYANCSDYSRHPRIRKWLETMAGLPGHDVAHCIWELVGDARRVEGGMRTIARANKEAARRIAEAVAEMPS